MRHFLPFSLVTAIAMGCRPDYAKVDPVDDNPNTAEASSEPADEPSGEVIDPETGEPIDPAEELRCCYGIEMLDYGGNGWQRGLLSVITDDGVYANVSLPDGFEGFREVCIPRGNNISFSWNQGVDNEEVGLGIFSFEGEDFYYGESPEAGILAETVSSCTDEYAVDSSHQEYDSTQDPIEEVDPEEPDYSDPEEFAGQYIGVFEMFSQDTGQQLCLVDMVIDIDQNGTFGASEVCSIYGQNVYVSHNGTLFTEIFEADEYGNVFGFGYLSGLVDLTDDTGMIQIQSEFYGECFMDASEPYINVYWDSLLYPPNGSPQNISGQLYYPY